MYLLLGGLEQRVLSAQPDQLDQQVQQDYQEQQDCQEHPV
jgi:hypothetical protein